MLSIADWQLFSAVSSGNLFKLEQLLNGPTREVNVNARKPARVIFGQKLSPLMSAVKSGNLSAVKILVGKGADPEVLQSNHNIVHFALEHNQPKIALWLAQHFKIPLNQQTKEHRRSHDLRAGMEAIHIPVLKNKVDDALELVRAGASINAPWFNPEAEATDKPAIGCVAPIHIAALNDWTDAVIRYGLEGNAIVDAPGTFRGRNIAHIAAAKRHYAAAESYLKAFGPKRLDPNAKEDQYEKTIGHYAAGFDDGEKVLEWVRDFGLDPNIPNINGETIAHYLAGFGEENSRLLAALKDLGADLNRKTNNGHTIEKLLKTCPRLRTEG